jgi:alkylhydroperoxidase family enzyme
VLADYKTAPISEKLRAMLGLLEKFTLAPDSLTVRDIQMVLDAGVTREAIVDAFYVAFLFNTYDRLADTLGWELPADRYYPKAGQFLLKRGYL